MSETQPENTADQPESTVEESEARLDDAASDSPEQATRQTPIVGSPIDPLFF